MFRIIENSSAHVLITGGAGFIGANLAAHLLATTEARITLFDNLSQPGAKANLAWLKSQACAGRLQFMRGDVRNAARLNELLRDTDEVYHLAARSAGVPESHADFEVNATGTLNVLEAARRSGRSPIVFYVSTAKVYKPISCGALQQEGMRYTPADPGFRGFSERAPANVLSPQICSRGAADQYLLDYARLYGVPAVVLRPDTVAGPRQIEHGWVANLVYSVLTASPVTVYGDGLQVHDVLHVADLVNALVAARDFRGVTSGNVYNVGGGPSHTISVNEMIGLIERVCHMAATVHHAPPRPEDRPWYMADCSAFKADTGWFARRSLEQTVRDIARFCYASRSQGLDVARFTPQLTHAA